MASGSDEKTLQHSQHLINEGKILVTRLLNGPEMTVMMQEYAKVPLMDYTHQRIRIKWDERTRQG